MFHKVLFGLFLCIAGRGWAISPPAPSPTGSPSPGRIVSGTLPTATPTGSPSVPESSVAPTPTPAEERVNEAEALKERIQEASDVTQLFIAFDDEMSQVALADRRVVWDEVKEEFVGKVLNDFTNGETVRGLGEYLDSSRDTQVLERFTLTEDYPVIAPHSSRVIAYTLLGTLDSARALERGAAGFFNPDNPEESAMVLRIMALADPGQSGPRVKRNFLELLDNDELRSSEHPALLEAFDSVIHAKAVDEIGRLYDLSRKGEREGLSWAAHLALQRLIEVAPTRSARELTKIVSLETEYPEGRASLFAMLDITVSDEELAVLSYLQEPTITGEERRAFSIRYPSFDGFDSTNLITTTLPPVLERSRTGIEIRTFCIDALAVVERWKSDGVLSGRDGEVNDMASNLRRCGGVPNEQPIPSPSSSP